MMKATLGNDTVVPAKLNSAGGLTKREYMAAMVLNGMMAAINYDTVLYGHHGHGTFDDYAKLAVKQADALLKALNSELDAQIRKEFG